MSILTPYIKWGEYKSNDENSPDVLQLKVSVLDTFETEYSVNTEIFLKTDDNKLESRILSLKSHASKNASLLKQWMECIQQKKIRKDSTINLKTWLGESRNGYPIRRFILNL